SRETQRLFALRDRLVAREKATTVWPEGNDCQALSRAKYRTSSPPHGARGRHLPIPNLSAPFATPDASSAVAACAAPSFRPSEPRRYPAPYVSPRAERKIPGSPISVPALASGFGSAPGASASSCRIA